MRVGEVKDAPAAPAAAFVVAVTTVDQEWGARLVKGWPDIGPQVYMYVLVAHTYAISQVANHPLQQQNRWSSFFRFF